MVMSRTPIQGVRGPRSRRQEEGGAGIKGKQSNDSKDNMTKPTSTKIKKEGFENNNPEEKVPKAVAELQDYLSPYFSPGGKRKRKEPERLDSNPRWCGLTDHLEIDLSLRMEINEIKFLREILWQVIP